MRVPVLAAALLVLGALAAGAPGASAADAPCSGRPVDGTLHLGPWHAEDLDRREIYRGPTFPSYTAWVGGWQMPDDSLMVGFTQAVGEPDPALRPAAPADLKAALGVDTLSPSHDFWGLALSAEYLRSTDGGASWAKVRSDPFHAVYPHPYAQGATTVLADGTLLRRVNGWDLRHDPSVPHTAYLQRLAPGAPDWSAPEVLLDPATTTYQISRIRHLRDGCLIALGQVWKTPAGTPDHELRRAPAALLMMVSADGGTTWQRNPLPLPDASAYIAPNEWDAAELPSGDLLAVFRTASAPGSPVEVRRQGILRRGADGWTLTDVRDSPLPHSGHPELLATREGIVLHVATTGVSYTADGGETWHPLTFFPDFPYASRYYPSSLQARDGRIHVFSATGWDAGYADVDESVIADTFRLSDAPVPAASPAAGQVADSLAGDRRITTTLSALVRVQGRRVRVSGKLRAAAPGGRLRGHVRLRFKRGSRARTVTVRAARRWKASARIRRPGRWTLRISYSGTTRHAPARMAPAVLRLR